MSLPERVSVHLQYYSKILWTNFEKTFGGKALRQGTTVGVNGCRLSLKIARYTAKNRWLYVQIRQKLMPGISVRRKTRPAYPVGAEWKSLIFEMYVFNCRLLGTHVIYTNRPIVAGMKTHTLRQKLAYDATDSYGKVMHLARGIYSWRPK